MLYALIIYYFNTVLIFCENAIDELRELGNFGVCRTTIHNTLKKLKITYKKVLFAAEQKREDVEIAREKWKQESPNWNIEHVEANEDSE